MGVELRLKGRLDSVQPGAKSSWVVSLPIRSAWGQEEGQEDD